MTDVMALRFERVQDSCCRLCNAPALADFERTCVRVILEHARPGQRTHGRIVLEACEACIALLMRALHGVCTVAELEPEIVQLIVDLAELQGREPPPTGGTLQ